MSRSLSQVLRASFFLLGAGLAGCRASPSLCEHTLPLTGPRDSDVFEARKPEAPPAMGGGQSPEMSLSPPRFKDDAWAADVFDELAPREAPVLSGAPPARGGAVLVCAFEVKPSPGIDGIGDLNGGTLVSISTPDLMVWANLAGTEDARGPKGSSLEATFAFTGGLRSGDPVTFTFGDHDWLSSNDYIGKIEGRYPGRVPFEVRGSAGSARCRAAFAERLAVDAQTARKRLDSALASFDAYEATIAEPLGNERLEGVEKALGEVEYFTETAGAARAEALRHVNASAGKQWSHYQSLLKALYDHLPPAGQWVDVGDFADARAAGLRCLIGDGWGKKQCDLVLEVRLRSAPGGSLCPVRDGELGELGSIGVVRADGSIGVADLREIQVDGGWIQEQIALSRLQQGAVLRIPLALGAALRRETHVGWNIPLVRVGRNYLRVY